jgi:transposase-like protein
MDFWLYGCRLQTISKFDESKGLSTIEAAKFWQTIKALRGRTECFCPRPLVTYRGVSREHLVEKLSSDTREMTEASILSHLFYFGDKAKHYYKHNDSEAILLRWLRRIEDVSRDTNGKIFTQIAKVLNHNTSEAISDFRLTNLEFCKYFRMAANRNSFVDVLCELGPAARDYYLCFLHTVGNIGIGDKSVLVSTTRSYKKAIEFAGDASQSFVIWYVIPRPIDNYAVSARSLNRMEETLVGKGLPVVKKALYPAQREYCIKGALFASHIIGVHLPHASKFVVNPHLFTDNNNACDMIHGLKIDQQDFENRLEQTSYHRGVGTCFDGNFHTIYRESSDSNAFLVSSSHLSAQLTP